MAHEVKREPITREINSIIATDCGSTTTKAILIEKIDGVYFDQLVEVIDNHVELVENYDEAVRSEYSIDSNDNDYK